MRQLFVPACLCLMTWSGTTGLDPKISLDQFTGARAASAETLSARAAADGKAEPVIAADPAAAHQPPVAPAPIAASEPVAEPIVVALAPSSDQTAVARGTARPADPAPELAIEYPASEQLLLTAAEVPPMPKSRPPPRPVVHRSVEEICDTLTQAAQSNDLPAPFFIRLLFQESRFKPGAVSHAGALGIAQFMPETANGMGLQNPFDPLQAIPASARLLRTLFSQFGNLGLAAAAYNAGPKRIQDWLSKKGSLPEETQGYVKIITGRKAENWKAPEAGSPAVKVPRQAPCQDAAGLLAWNGPNEIPVPPSSPVRLAAMAKEKADREAAEAAAAKRATKTEVKTAAKSGADKTAAKPSKDVAKIAAKVVAKGVTKTVSKPATKTADASARKGDDKGAVEQLAARERKPKNKDKNRDKDKTKPMRLTQR